MNKPAESPDDEPRWVTELQARLYQHDADDHLRYTYHAHLNELGAWLRTARGKRWSRNHWTLRSDYTTTRAHLDPALAAELAPDITRYEPDLLIVLGNKKPTAEQFSAATEANGRLLSALSSRAAAAAAWDDLVTGVQDDDTDDPTLRRRLAAIRHIVDARGDDGKRRLATLGLIMARVGQDIVSAQVELGQIPSPEDWPAPNELVEMSILDRLALCRSVVATPSEPRRCIGWVAFWGQLPDRHVTSGPITFYDGPFALGDDPEARNLPHLDDLDTIHSPPRTGDPKDEGTIILARVDLGIVPIHQATATARRRATAVADIAALSAGAPWREIGWQELQINGEFRGGGHYETSEARLLRPNRVGAQRTATQLRQQAEVLGATIARGELPIEIEDAVRTAHAAQRTDVRTRVIHHHQIVELIAAHANIDTEKLIQAALDHWAFHRWSGDVQSAVYNAAHLPHQPTDEQIAEDLYGQIITNRTSEMTHVVQLLVAAEHAQTLIGCLSTETNWRDGQLIASMVDAKAHLRRHKAEAAALEKRRQRVRNALVHGNPINADALGSVEPLTRYLATLSLNSSIDAHKNGRTVQDQIRRGTEHRQADLTRLEDGESMRDIWRTRDQPPSP